MFRWALTFFILALIAAVFGFTGIAPVITKAAQFSFFLMVILFLLTLIFGVPTREK